MDNDERDVEVVELHGGVVHVGGSRLGVHAEDFAQIATNTIFILTRLSLMKLITDVHKRLYVSFNRANLIWLHCIRSTGR